MGTVTNLLARLIITKGKKQLVKSCGNIMGLGKNLGQCVPEYENVAIRPPSPNYVISVDYIR